MAGSTKIARNSGNSSVLLITSLARMPLVLSLRACNGGETSKLARFLGHGSKAWMSSAGYLIGIGLAFKAPLLSCVLHASFAAIWFIPDQRIERGMADPSS